MLFSSGLVKRLFYFLAKKRRGVGGGNSETNSKQSEPIGDGKLSEFDRIKKERGYGYFTYDINGKLTGMAYMPPVESIPSTNEVD
jgi:hypothetical protein